MRFAVNENIPRAVVHALRGAEHDVLSVKETMRGEEDRTILARARTESRIVVTQDKDFGELAFHYGLPAEAGIILFRLFGGDAETDTRRMVDVLMSRGDWAGHFVVVSNDRVRMRPLAGAFGRGE